MKAIYRPFKSIEEIKARGEFIPKGRIFPARILKAEKRKYQRLVTAGSNIYVFPTPSGYVLFVEGDFPCHAYEIAKSVTFFGSPYFGGKTSFFSGIGEAAEVLEKFNRGFLSSCLVSDGVTDCCLQLQINVDYASGLPA